MNSMLTWNSWRAEMAADEANEARWRKAEAMREDFMGGDDRGCFLYKSVYKEKEGILVSVLVEDFGLLGFERGLKGGG